MKGPQEPKKRYDERTMDSKSTVEKGEILLVNQWTNRYSSICIIWNPQNIILEPLTNRPNKREICNYSLFGTRMRAQLSSKRKGFSVKYDPPGYKASKWRWNVA